MNGSNTPDRIVKRDGTVAVFQPEKIEQAIFKAMRAVEAPDRKAAHALAEEVVRKIADEHRLGTPTVEQVQDTVEQTLFNHGYFALVKAYLLYRKQHEQLRSSKELLSNLDVIDDYLSMADWRIKESANSAYSLQGLNQHISTMITAQYWLSRLYPDSIAEAHKSGALHIFQSGIHISPVAYLIRYRLSRAAGLLYTTQKAVSVIASETGFTSAGYFCRKFREYYHMSPGEYRQKKSST